MTASPPTADVALPPFPAAAWRGLFGDYRTLIAGISECPLPFHFANFLAVAAAELGDRIRFAEGAATFLNFYIFICGRTGTKKSTATDLVQENIVEQMPTTRHASFSAVSSAEGLIRVLSQAPEGNVLLCYDEIADLFATANRVGQRIEPVLNKAFGLKPLATIVKRQRDSLVAVNYYLNILANGTPDHVRLELSEALFSGGLLNRFLVFASEPSGRSMPEMGVVDMPRAQEIAARLASITAAWQNVAAGRGSVHVALSQDAKAVHAEWYHRHTLAVQGMHDMESKPLTRLDLYTKKLAGIYCVLETAPCPAPEVTGPQMAAALAVLEYCKASMLWTTRAWTGQQSVQRQAEVRAEERIEAYLQAQGCSTERNLYRTLHLSATECGRILNALAGTGIVYIQNDRPRMVHYTERCKCFKPPPGLTPPPTPAPNDAT